MDRATLTQASTQIPVRALLAHAVRCARRVQPLFFVDPAHPEAEHLTAAVDLAIRLSADFAAGRDVDPELAAEAEDAAVRAILAASEGSHDEDGLQASAYAANAAYAVIDAMTEAMSLPHSDRPSVVAENICNSITIAIDAAFSADKTIEAEARRDWQRLQELELGQFPELGEPVDPSDEGALGPLFQEPRNRTNCQPQKRNGTPNKLSERQPSPDENTSASIPPNTKARPPARHRTSTTASGLTPEELELRARLLDAEQKLKNERDRVREERTRLERQEEELVARMVEFDDERKKWDELRQDGDGSLGGSGAAEADQERKQLQAERQILKFDQETLRADREALEEGRRELEAQVAEFQAMQQAAAAEPEAKLLAELEQLREEVDRLQQEREAASSAEPSTPAASANAAEIAEFERRLSIAESLRESLEQELANSVEQCQALEMAAAELERERDQLREEITRAQGASQQALNTRRIKKSSDETLTAEEIAAFRREAEDLRTEKAALLEGRAALARQEAEVQKSLLNLKRSWADGVTAADLASADHARGRRIPEAGLEPPGLAASGGPRYVPFDTAQSRDTREAPTLFIVLKPGKATAVKIAEVLHAMVLLYRQVGGNGLRFEIAAIRMSRLECSGQAADEAQALVALRTLPADRSGFPETIVDRSGWQRFNSCMFLSLKPRPGLAQRFEQADLALEDNGLRQTLTDAIRRVRQSFSSQQGDSDAGLQIDSLNQQMRRMRELLESVEQELSMFLSIVPAVDLPAGDSSQASETESAVAEPVTVPTQLRRRRWVPGFPRSRKEFWLMFGASLVALGYALWI